MGSFNGAARTNFFKVENLNGLQEALEPFDIKIVWHGSIEGFYERAAKKFEVDEGVISECRYSDLPEYLMDLERGRTWRLENMVEHGFRWQNEAALLWQMAARSGENEPLEYLVRLGADPLEHRAVFEMKGAQAASRAWFDQHVMQREIERPVQTGRSSLRRSM